MAHGVAVIAEIDIDPDAARLYAEGWQSWSPSLITRARERIVQRPADERLRDHFWRRDASWFDPGLDIPGTVQADGGLLAVEHGRGDGVTVFCAPDPGSIPVIRATPHGNRTLMITADGRCVQQDCAGSLEEALAGWAVSWPSMWGPDWGPDGPRWTVRDDRPPPTAWCSWYSHGRSVGYAAVEATMEAIERHALPVQTLLWDDGYFSMLGDWRTSVRPDLGSLTAMAGRVRDRGYGAGLWLCPTLARAGSAAVRNHPEAWVPGIDAPFGRHRRVRALDPTSAAGADYLTCLIQDVVAAGFNWLKIDFMWTGALPGPRRSGAGPVTAYREALRLIRAAAGPGTWIMGCGTPLLPSAHGGLTATRISPDTGPQWEPERGDLSQPSGRSAVQTGRARAFHKTLTRPDPDVLMCGPGVQRREDIAAYVESLPEHLRVTGDRLGDLDEWGLETTRRVLARNNRA